MVDVGPDRGSDDTDVPKPWSEFVGRVDKPSTDVPERKLRGAAGRRPGTTLPPTKSPTRPVPSKSAAAATHVDSPSSGSMPEGASVKCPRPSFR